MRVLLTFLLVLACVGDTSAEVLIAERINEPSTEIGYSDLGGNKLIGYVDISKNNLPIEFRAATAKILVPNSRDINAAHSLTAYSLHGKYIFDLTGFGPDRVLSRYRTLNVAASIPRSCMLVAEISTVDRFNNDESKIYRYSTSKDPVNFVEIYNNNDSKFIGNQYAYQVMKIFGVQNITSQKYNTDGQNIFHGRMRAYDVSGEIKLTFRDTSKITRINLKGNFGGREILEYVGDQFQIVDRNSIKLKIPSEAPGKLREFFVYSTTKVASDNLLNISTPDDVGYHRDFRFNIVEEKGGFSLYSIDLHQIANRTALSVDSISLKVESTEGKNCSVPIREIFYTNYKYVDKDAFEIADEARYKKFEKINRLIYERVNEYWASNVSNYVLASEIGYGSDLTLEVDRVVPDSYLYIDSRVDKKFKVTFKYRGSNSVNHTVHSNKKYPITDSANLSSIRIDRLDEEFNGLYIYKPVLAERSDSGRKRRLYDGAYVVRGSLIEGDLDRSEEYQVYRFPTQKYNLIQPSKLSLNFQVSDRGSQPCKSYLELSGNFIPICGNNSDSSRQFSLAQQGIDNLGDDIYLHLHRSSEILNNGTNLLSVEISARYYGYLEDYLRRSLVLGVDDFVIPLFPFVNNFTWTSPYKVKFEIDPLVNGFVERGEFIRLERSAIYDFYKLTISGMHGLEKKYHFPVAAVLFTLYLFALLKYRLIVKRIRDFCRVNSVRVLVLLRSLFIVLLLVSILSI